MMRVHKYLLPIIAIIALLGTVLVARAAGYWQTSGRQMVNVVDGIGSLEIKGWMTLRDVSDGTGIPMETLRPLLGIPPEVADSTPLKELEGVISVSEVRSILGTYLGE